MSDKQVTLYTATGCPHCQAAKKYLDENDVNYEEKDTAQSDQAAKEHSERGFTKVPVLVTGQTTVEGFERDQIDQALGLKQG